MNNQILLHAGFCCGGIILPPPKRVNAKWIDEEGKPYSKQDIETIKKNPKLRGARHRLRQAIQETQGIYDSFI